MSCEYCNTVTGDGSLKAYLISDYVECSLDGAMHDINVAITPDAELAIYVDGEYAFNTNMASERIDFCPKCGEDLTPYWT